jgi:hypothetical protein
VAVGVGQQRGQQAGQSGRDERLGAAGQLGQGPPALAEQGGVLEAVEVGLAAVGNVAFQPGEVDPFPLVGVVAAEPEADRTDPDAWADPGMRMPVSSASSRWQASVPRKVAEFTSSWRTRWRSSV